MPFGQAAKENLPVAELAKSFGGQPEVLATSATVGVNSSAASPSGEHAEKQAV
jgi:hypothetical protein